MSAILLGLVLQGCQGLSGGGGGDGVTHDAVPAIAITTPEEGSGVYGDVGMQWDVAHFQLEDAAGKGDVDGQGHVHVYVDGEQVGETADTSWLYDTLASGDHTLEVRLATNDHTELPYSDWVWLHTCDPSVTVTGPAGPLAASSAPLSVTVTGFTLSDTFGDPVFGEGHFLIRADGEPLSRGIDPTKAAVTRLSSGDHTIDVELVNNDDTSLDPPVVSEPITVSVAAAAPYIGFADSWDALWNSATLPVDVQVLNVAGGSYHLYVDGVWAGAGITSLRHLAPGLHDLRAVLTDGAGSESMVFDAAQVYVADSRPDVTITSPGDAWTIHPDIQMSVYPENFLLDGTSAVGHGKYEVAVDGVAAGTGTGATTPVPGLTAGAHTIRVSLVNGDGSPLDPPVYDEIHVNVN
jgi:hypothetical protein